MAVGIIMRAKPALRREKMVMPEKAGITENR